MSSSTPFLVTLVIIGVLLCVVFWPGDDDDDPFIT